MDAALDSVQCNTQLLRYSMTNSSDKHWSAVINASLSDAKHYLI
jgi:very-short-patch-repair endonuclease